MSEILSAEQWLYSALAADATLVATGATIYSGLVSQGATFPLVYVTLQRQDDDLMTVGTRRIWSTLHYAVRGVAETSSWKGTLLTLADRIDAALHAQSGTSTQGTVWECVREAPFALVEQADGREFRHLGGLYRLRAI